MPPLHRLSPIFRPKRRKNEMHVCAPINRLGVLRSPTQALPPTWISLFLTRISNLLSDTLSNWRQFNQRLQNLREEEK